MRLYVSERDNLWDDICTGLRDYLQGDTTGVDLPGLFPNFGAASVRKVHPFAVLQAAEINGSQMPAGLFPSVTVAVTTEQQTQQALGYAGEAELVTAAQVNAWLILKPERKLISDARLKTLLDAVQAGAVWGMTTSWRYIQHLVFSVWTESDTVTQTLYQLARAYVLTHMDVLETNGLEEVDLAGTPSGLYNTDLGRVLFGAELTVSGTTQTVDRVIDTDWTTIGRIEHSVAHEDIE